MLLGKGGDDFKCRRDKWRGRKEQSEQEKKLNEDAMEKVRNAGEMGRQKMEVRSQ